jgi:hypothetical protein
LLIGALGFGYWMLRDGFGSIKFLAVAALVAALGLWQLVFGVPKRVDGMTPAWWRIGLLATAIGFVLAAFGYMSD